MLEVNKKAFIHIGQHDILHKNLNSNFTLVSDLDDNPGTGNEYVEVEIKYKVPSFLIKLRPMEYNMGTYYHLISDGKMEYKDFTNLIRHLRSMVQTENQKCNWNIYNGQPVWEFKCNPDLLTTYIQAYHGRIVVEVGN